ncbi:MAG: M48 family metallopeptidase [Azoarcus sp.]|jgi:Zn-dependent protease with chaperone function|nr:M48 family metallopeptidase [Azoarcus sp.]
MNAEPATRSVPPFRPPHFRLFVLRGRLAACLTLAAAASLLSVPLLALLLGGFGALVAFGCWLLWGATWPLLAISLGSVAAVLACYAAVCLLSVLLVPLPAPEGIRLSPTDAPELFRLIASMSRVLAAGRIDHVWVTPDINASVLQRPRRGFFGRIETHLLIGLPLAHSVTRAQLMAVLAHEFSHLALQRKGFGKYGALLRAWWLRVLDRIGDVFPVLGARADRWLHRFYCNMARLARIEEFEADAFATKLVDADLLGGTLIEVSLKGQFLSRDYWPRVLAQSKVRAKPLVRPYRDLGLGMAAGFMRASADDALSGDEPRPLHPNTRERLRALRASPCPPLSGEQTSAARHYLAPLLLTLAWVFDRAWWQGVRPDWQLTYSDACGKHLRKQAGRRRDGGT